MGPCQVGELTGRANPATTHLTRLTPYISLLRLGVWAVRLDADAFVWFAPRYDTRFGGFCLNWAPNRLKRSFNDWRWTGEDDMQRGSRASLTVMTPPPSSMPVLVSQGSTMGRSLSYFARPTFSSRAVLRSPILWPNCGPSRLRQSSEDERWTVGGQRKGRGAVPLP